MKAKYLDTDDKNCLLFWES